MSSLKMVESRKFWVIWNRLILTEFTSLEVAASENALLSFEFLCSCRCIGNGLGIGLRFAVFITTRSGSNAAKLETGMYFGSIEVLCCYYSQHSRDQNLDLTHTKFRAQGDYKLRQNKRMNSVAFYNWKPRSNIKILSNFSANFKQDCVFTTAFSLCAWRTFEDANFPSLCQQRRNLARICQKRLSFSFAEIFTDILLSRLCLPIILSFIKHEQIPWPNLAIKID